MFFKRIEMTGFKSFATKTVVEFMPGVTVVVGPNGCGKSNIFDAIRWVLGEQSAKSLRGSKMGDVIFQGSATYKPMGCAQVNLIINNEDGRLPIDFSEVSVTRRLYRSGESEYLLNKVPCRLRDIHDLFLDTGVGTESYSIMEQGRVDDIVRSRPEERRELFEEAAGISKYKARRTEALRKLERTEHDLIRLADRIAESRTRTISLKRAAAKAERYKGLREAADAIEKKLLVLNASRLRADFDKIEKDYTAAKDRMTALQAQASTVEARREELLLKVEEADQRLRDLSIQKEDQRHYIQEAATETMRLKNLADNEKRRAQDLLEQISENSIRKDELAVNLAEANAEEARLTVRLIALEAKQNVRRAEYERLRGDTESTRSKIREARKALDAANAETQRLRGEHTRLRFMLEQSASFLEDFDRQKREHDQTLEQLAAEISDKASVLEQRRADLKRFQESLSTTQTEVRNALLDRDALRVEHRKTEQKLHEMRSRLRALEKFAREYEGYYRGVKAVMLASGEKRLDGIVGVVPELIQSIRPEHDLALEVALGNHAQDIVVHRDEHAKRAVQFLKTEQAGQATLLPLNVLDGREGGPDIEAILRGTAGIVGLASRLVQYDSLIEKAVFNLLGRTIVTENLDVSMQLIRSGKRQRYVTLDGDLSNPSGAITGGSRRQSQIISRQREITSLTEEVAALEQEESGLQKRIARREKDMTRLDAECAKIRERIQELRIEVAQSETEMASRNDRRAQLAALLENLRQRATAGREDSERLLNETGACAASLEDLESRAQTQRDDLLLMEEAVYERNTELDSLGENVSQGEHEITRLRERCAHLRENAESLHGQERNLSRRDTQLRNDRTRAFQAAQGFLEQAARVEEEKTALEKEVATIDDRRKAVAEEKEKAQIAGHVETERAQKIVRDLNEATNRHSETHESYVNAQATLRQLRERASERFQSSLEDMLQEAGGIEEDRAALSEELDGLHEALSRMGDNIHMGALIEYEEEQNRYEFLTAQQTDLMQARDSLTETIETIDQTTRKMFHEAFESIRRNFIEMYRSLFGGGKADLILQEVEDGDPLLDGGIEIVAQPPGKKLQNVTLLSGGEKALTAVSLMFAIFLYKPSPFCVMDEIDAPLDDANVLRFRERLREFCRNTQFIIITHNKITMNLADTIYGITMQETGVSSLVSVRFDQVDKLAANAS